MSEPWNVTFMKNGEPVGDTQTVEADGAEQAIFVAKHMHPELDAKSDGALVMEAFDDLSPLESLQHVGNIWDELREVQAYRSLTPKWADMSGPAKSAFTYYFREYCPLEKIVQTVLEINTTVGRMN